jgi:hypothetical protein
MAATIQKQLTVPADETILQTLLVIFEKISEAFWFLLCLSLFVALGPFSAPVALIALYKLAAEQQDAPEPESVG